MRVDRVLLAGILVWALAAFVPLGRAASSATADPQTHFLIDDDATWVIVDQPFHANPRREAGRAVFVRPFEVARDEPLQVTVHALGGWTLLLDGVVLQHGAKDAWRQGVAVDLGRLGPGPHDLAVDVTNGSGPAALAIAGAPLTTPEGWHATLDGTSLVDVRRADDRPLPAVSYAFPSTVEALAARLPTVFGVAVIVLVGHLLGRRRAWPEPPPRVVVGFGVVIVGVWTASALGLPRVLGFDAEAHHDYLAFLVDGRALPTANDGWQMFQPPLFYLLAAPLFAAGRALGGDWGVVLARVVPLLCGLGLTMVLGQTLTLASTKTTWAQHRAFLIAACLPVSLTMYRFNGNEPLAALLTASAITMTLGIGRDDAPRVTRFVALGVVAGLATLAKMSAIVVAPRSPARCWLAHAEGARGNLASAACCSSRRRSWRPVGGGLRAIRCCWGGRSSGAGILRAPLPGGRTRASAPARTSPPSAPRSSVRSFLPSSRSGMASTAPSGATAT
jgi:hypothetical protein